MRLWNIKFNKPMSKIFVANKGFIATTAVIMLACSVILYESVTLASAVDFADSVMRQEWRIQANLNAESCASTVALMAVKDYFLSGEVSVPEFRCIAQVTHNRVSGVVNITVKAQNPRSGGFWP